RLAECADALDATATQGLPSALEEFEHKMSQIVLAHDAGSYLRRLTATSIGSDRAERLFAPPVAASRPLETIRAARAATLAEALTAAGGLGAGSDEGEFDGVAFAASLLNDLPAGDSERLLGALESSHAALAPKVREAMFTFEDLGKLDGRGLQMLMREIQS